MYKSAIAGLSLLTIITIVGTASKASALELEEITSLNVAVSDTAEVQIELPGTKEQEEKKEKEPEVVKYKIEKNDSLSKVAKKFETTWKRIYDKNTQIEHPDVISVNDEIVIPNQDEKLEEREIPEGTTLQEEPVSPAPKPAVTKSTKRTAKVTTAPRGSASGNLYVPGYCTWYVKNIRSDLPNNLGNANTWVARARAQGMATGSTPRAGAVGQRGMHVVYVKSVNSDGTVNITEMNHKGLYVVSERTLPGNYFTYIY